MKKARDSFSLKDNILSCLIEIKKIFVKGTLKVTIAENNYNVVGRLGMYHSIIDITNEENIKIGDKAFIEISPMYVNSIIRREYI